MSQLNSGDKVPKIGVALRKIFGDENTVEGSEELLQSGDHRVCIPLDEESVELYDKAFVQGYMRNRWGVQSHKTDKGHQADGHLSGGLRALQLISSVVEDAGV